MPLERAVPDQSHLVGSQGEQRALHALAALAREQRVERLRARSGEVEGGSFAEASALSAPARLAAVPHQRLVHHDSV